MVAQASSEIEKVPLFSKLTYHNAYYAFPALFLFFRVFDTDSKKGFETDAYPLNDALGSLLSSLVKSSLRFRRKPTFIVKRTLNIKNDL